MNNDIYIHTSQQQIIIFQDNFGHREDFVERTGKRYVRISKIVRLHNAKRQSTTAFNGARSDVCRRRSQT